jgi:AraC-like DNA-binding protein
MNNHDHVTVVVRALTWNWLTLNAAVLRRKPKVSEVAAMAGMRQPELRRRLSNEVSTIPTIRRYITNVCFEYAAQLISSGVKIEAARELAGFRQKTNFNKRFVALFGCLPSSYYKNQSSVIDAMPSCGHGDSNCSRRRASSSSMTSMVTNIKRRAADH